MPSTTDAAAVLRRAAGGSCSADGDGGTATSTVLVTRPSTDMTTPRDTSSASSSLYCSENSSVGVHVVTVVSYRRAAVATFSDAWQGEPGAESADTESRPA
jgi:hypothetical protein